PAEEGGRRRERTLRDVPDRGREGCGVTVEAAVPRPVGRAVQLPVRGRPPVAEVAAGQGAAAQPGDRERGPGVGDRPDEAAQALVKLGVGALTDGVEGTGP